MRRELHPLQVRFKKEVSDHCRTLDEARITAEERAEEVLSGQRAAENRASHYLRLASAAEESLGRLQDTEAQLRAELLTMRDEEKARLRRAAVDVRAQEAAQKKEDELASALHKEEVRMRQQMQRRVAAAEQKAAAAAERADEAQAEAARAREEAMAEAAAAQHARAAEGEAQYATLLATRQPHFTQCSHLPA
eukprot:3179556-Prymnesium_polylepis.1